MNGIISICFAKIDFQCPFCGKEESDEDEKFLKRINKNKKGYTTKKCENCNKKYGIAFDWKGNIVSFELRKEPKCK